MNLPNLLSSSRFLLALLMPVAIMNDHWIVALGFYVLAVASDLGDGYLARARDQVTRLGGLLDHSSDAVFVTATLGALAVAGPIPAPLPVLVMAAFGQYVLDSAALKGKPLRASRLGRYNGIAYFVLAGVPVIQAALGLNVFDLAMIALAGWLLVGSTLVSMADRLLALWQTRQNPS